MLKPAIYIVSIFFVLAWWTIAFYEHTTAIPQTDSTPPAKLVTPHLSTLERSSLKRALTGDDRLMRQLILEWDIDAEILLNRGYQSKRLNGDELRFTRLYERMGTHKTSKRILPQTYFSTWIVLALAEPKNIIGIPPGIRKELQIHPEFLNDIPIDFTPYTLDSSLSTNIDIAFIAPYSNPNIIQALRARKIKIFDHGNTQDFDEIATAIEKIGTELGVPHKAKLLTIFMKAALINIDNRLLVKPLKETVYLDSITTLSAPEKTTILGKLLARSGINKRLHGLSRDGWTTDVAVETLLRYDPDKIILPRLGPLPKSLNNLRAAKDGEIYTLDPHILNCSAQFYVLAYFDLVGRAE